MCQVENPVEIDDGTMCLAATPPPGPTGQKKLVGRGAVKFLLLPQVSGLGYYSYVSIDRQYGTPKTINTVREVAKTFVTKMPHVLIGIGDISLAQGGRMSPHATHQHGTNVDIRPLRKDGKQSPVDITDPQYSRENTKILVASLSAHKNVKRILFNDTAIAGVYYLTGHNNHLHVEMKS